MSEFLLTNACGAVLLLSFLLLINPKKANVKANIWFGFFCLALFFILLEDELRIIGLEIKNEFIIELISIPSIVVAPLFYLCVTYFINPNRNFRKKDLVHLGLVLLYFMLLATKYLFNVNEENSTIKIILEIISVLFFVLFVIQLVMYAIFSYIQLIRHKKNIKLFSSNINSIDLSWLRTIIISVGILSLLWAIDIALNFSNETFIYFALFVSIPVISYHALKQEEIYPFKREDQNNIIALIEENRGNTNQEDKKQVIPDDKLEEIKALLLKIMETDKPYLNCELSLPKLSSMLNISTHILSYTINKGFNESFYLFVNKYRVEEAKKVILNPNMNHLSILGAGFEVGFNSKSSFYSTFKKITGQTPNEFKKLKSGSTLSVGTLK